MTALVPSSLAGRLKEYATRPFDMPGEGQGQGPASGEARPSLVELLGLSPSELGLRLPDDVEDWSEEERALPGQGGQGQGRQAHKAK